jgi:putative sporulation protein YtaF
MLLGHGAARLLPVSAAKHLGAALIFLVGLWIGLEAWLEQLEPAHGDEPQRLLRISLGAPGLWLEILRDPQQADVDRSGVIDLREALLLGIALSLNNLGTGLGAGLNGYPVLMTTGLTAVGSWLTISGGAWLGRISGGRFQARSAGYVAMLILLGLAVWEWGH